MSRRLPRSFYTRPTLVVARDLLGKYLVHVQGGRTRRGKIVETEAYIGPQDRAAHSFGGRRTDRTRIKYEQGGSVYIYLVYGMYWQLNITTAGKEEPECVLIRALEVDGESSAVANGPGKLCRWMKLDKSFYGEDLTRSSRLWVEDRSDRVRRKDIVTSPRVGIDYAGPVWAAKPWRFCLRGNPAVSKPWPRPT
ncbi:MAG: DNA-3-methyladenine glycosylase [Parcubacteria group bacterium Gr01-1014_106]|nr:MAG: DNA-3-methyladenine glycosylase [Parcubacteria group bacterium Gr01-1014_106]